MLEVYKPHTNREAVGVWFCSAAKRPTNRSALVILYSAFIHKLAVSSISVLYAYVHGFDSQTWLVFCLAFCRSTEIFKIICLNHKLITILYAYY